MTIDLPADLEQVIHEQVQAGRYPSGQAVVLAALEQLRGRTPRPSPGTGSIGALREDAELLDQAVEHAMRVRERRWGLTAGK
jgi:Arc/MetJ-type ribon-helix-helix transcriptional regulator